MNKKNIVFAILITGSALNTPVPAKGSLSASDIAIVAGAGLIGTGITSAILYGFLKYLKSSAIAQRTNLEVIGEAYQGSRWGGLAGAAKISLNWTTKIDAARELTIVNARLSPEEKANLAAGKPSESTKKALEGAIKTILSTLASENVSLDQLITEATRNISDLEQHLTWLKERRDTASREGNRTDLQQLIKAINDISSLHNALLETSTALSIIQKGKIGGSSSTLPPTTAPEEKKLAEDLDTKLNIREKVETIKEDDTTTDKKKGDKIATKTEDEETEPEKSEEEPSESSDNESESEDEESEDEE